MDAVLHMWLKEASIISNQSLSELDPIMQCMFSVVARTDKAGKCSHIFGELAIYPTQMMLNELMH